MSNMKPVKSLKKNETAGTLGAIQYCGKLKLKKTTPRAMQIISKAGLLTDDTQAAVKAKRDLFVDETALREVCQVVFDEDVEGWDFNEIDLEEISKGISYFLLRVLVV